MGVTLLNTLGYCARYTAIQNVEYVQDGVLRTCTRCLTYFKIGNMCSSEFEFFKFKILIVWDNINYENGIIITWILYQIIMYSDKVKLVAG